MRTPLLIIRCGMVLVSVLLVGIVLAYDSQKKNLLPCPEFPLSEGAVETALEDSGLDWSIERVDQETFEESIPRVTYSLSLPEDKADFTTVFIVSFQPPRFGRFMQMIQHFNAARVADFQEAEVSWTDFQQILELAARLYGGFRSPDEIYQACRSAPLPKEKRTLWQGQLTGGYCVIRAFPSIQSWKKGKAGNIDVTVYETESAFQQIWEESRANYQEARAKQQGKAVTN